MWKPDDQIKNENPMEEHIVNFNDGSEKELPLNTDAVKEAKHIGMLRNTAGYIQNAVDRAASAIKKNDLVEAGRELEKINGLAEFIIENS